MGILDVPGYSRPAAESQFDAMRGNRLVGLGDSTLQNAASDNPYNGSTHRWQNSWLTMAAAISGQRIRIVKHAGVWGSTTAQMLSRFDDSVKAFNPDVVVILGGRNDQPAGMTTDQSLANIAEIVTRVRAIGASPVVCLPLPTHTSAPEKQFMATLTNKLRAWTLKNRVRTIDFYALGADINGDLSAAIDTGDHKHPSNAGIKAMALVAEPVLSAMMPAVPQITAVDNADTDNLTVNPFFVGIDSGVTVGGWSKGAAIAGFETYSTVDVAGWKGKAMDITTTTWPSVAPSAQIRQNTAIGSTVAVGDVVEFSGRFKVLANTLPEGKRIQAGLLFEGNGEFISALDTNNVFEGIFQIRHTVPAGTTSIRKQLMVPPDTVGAARVQFGEIALRNITKLGLA